jgi:hypothetical protein
LRLLLPALCLPAALVFLSERYREPSVIAATTVIFVNSIAVMWAHMLVPSQAPLLESWTASTFAALAIQGVGQHILGHDRLKPLRPTIVALVLIVSVSVQAAIALSAPPYGFSASGTVETALSAAVLIGLPFLLVTALFGPSSSGQITAPLLVCYLEARLLCVGSA